MVNPTECQVSLGATVIERNRSLSSASCTTKLHLVRNTSAHCDQNQGFRKGGENLRRFGFEFQSPLEVLDTFLEALQRPLIPVEASAQIEMVSARGKPDRRAPLRCLCRPA